MNRNTLAGRRGGGAARSGSEGTDREGIDRDGEGGEAMPQGVPEAPRAFAAEAGAQRRRREHREPGRKVWNLGGGPRPRREARERDRGRRRGLLRSGRGDGRGGAEEVRWPWSRGGRGTPRGGAGKGGHGGPKRHGQGRERRRQRRTLHPRGRLREAPIVGGVPIVRVVLDRPGIDGRGFGKFFFAAGEGLRGGPLLGPAARLG